MAEPVALLTGWGRTAPSSGSVRTPTTVDAVIELVRGPARSVLGRGLGRSYGDAAQSAGGQVLSGLGLLGIDLDESSGVATVGAGVSLDDLLLAVVPRGWFVPVSPGTRFVTIGGAIAADVHGKNHHVDGTFGAHVLWLELVDGTGTLRRLGPQEDGEAFWATVGGLGLTGMIVRAALRLRRVESSRMAVDTERADSLDALMSRLRDHDAGHPYTVAWIDVLSSGRHLGRGVITSGRHARADETPGSDALAYRPRPLVPAPPLPVSVVNRLTARAFNEVWYRKAPRHPSAAVMPLEAFFHPLDQIRDWNRLYGPAGFLQYQFVVPDGREDVVRYALEALHAASTPAFLAVLKRFGAAGPAPLSFPQPGWTLAMDLPTSTDGRLARVLDHLDEQVVEAGGSVYLVKDARCRAELVDAMYPRLPLWRKTRDRLDPDHRFTSDLSRRVGL